MKTLRHSGNIVKTDINWCESHTFPKLKTFTYDTDGQAGYYQSQQENMLNSFLMNNHNLTSLSLTVKQGFRTFKLELIAQLKNLQELYLEMNYDSPFQNPSLLNLQPLYDLAKLRKIIMLKIPQSMLTNFSNQTASVETLKHLSLSTTVYDSRFLSGLSCLHQLRYLSLHSTRLII